MTNNQKINVFIGKILNEQMDPLATNLNDRLSPEEQEEFENIQKVINAFKQDGSFDKIKNDSSEWTKALLKKFYIESDIPGSSLWDLVTGADGVYEVAGAGFALLLLSKTIKESAVGAMAFFPALRSLATNLSQGIFSSSTLFLLRAAMVYSGINILGDLSGIAASPYLNAAASSIASGGMGAGRMLNSSILLKIKEFGTALLDRIKGVSSGASPASSELEETVRQTIEQMQRSSQQSSSQVANAKSFPRFTISKEFLEELDQTVKSFMEKTSGSGSRVVDRASELRSTVQATNRMTRGSMKINLIRSASSPNSSKSIGQWIKGQGGGLFRSCLNMFRQFINQAKAIAATLIFGTAAATAGGFGATTGALASSIGGAAGAGAAAIAATVAAGIIIGGGFGLLINKSFFDDESRWLDDTNTHEILHGEVEPIEMIQLLEQMLPSSGGIRGFKDKFTLNTSGKIKKWPDKNDKNISATSVNDRVNNSSTHAKYLMGQDLFGSSVSKDDIYSILAMIWILQGSEKTIEQSNKFLGRLSHVANLDHAIKSAREEMWKLADENKLKLPYLQPFQGNLITNILLSSKGFQLYSGKDSPIGIVTKNGSQYLEFRGDNFDYSSLRSADKMDTKSVKKLSGPLIRNKFQYGKGDIEPKGVQGQASYSRLQSLEKTKSYAENPTPGILDFPNEVPIPKPNQNLSPHQDEIDLALKYLIKIKKTDDGRVAAEYDKESGQHIQLFPNGIRDLASAASYFNVPIQGSGIPNELVNRIKQEEDWQRNVIPSIAHREKNMMAAARKRAAQNKKKMSAKPPSPIKESIENDLYWKVRNMVDSSIFIN